MLRKNVASQFLHFAGVNATTGAALTGATFSYRRCIDGTFAAGGGTITEDTGTGFYKVALAQADTNGNDLAFFFTATNAIPVCINALTTAADPSDTVRYGLTALPNVASGSAGAVITSGTGTAQLSVSSGLVTLAGVTHTGAVIPTVTTTTTATNVTTVNGLAAGVITAASIAADAITDAKVAADVTIASVTGAVGSVTGNVGGNVTGSVGSVATGGISAASFAAGAIDAAAIAANAIGASELAADAVAEIADAVWDEAIAGHLTAGSTGESLNAAGAAGDPWVTALPGAYGAGSAGFIVGTNLNATVSSRSTLDAAGIRTAVGLASANLDTQLDALPTATENADALLNRDMSAVSDTTARSPLNALRFIRNKWDVAAGTLTVKKEDDTTTAWTATVSSNAAADPIVGTDPA